MRANVTLEDICTLIVDCEHKTAPLATHGYPSIRTPNIGRGRLLLDTVNRVTDATYQAWTKRAVPQADDLIVAREAPIGNVAIIPRGLDVCLGQRTVLVRPNRSRVDPAYLCYFLLGDYAQAKFRATSAGATVAHLNMRDIRNLALPTMPPLPIQRRIASILGAYDDLIEVNRRRIAVLEEMARRLFDEWFVHFRFPGHEGHRMVETEHGRLPEGWEVRTVEEMVKRVPVGKKYDLKTVNSTGAVPVFDQGRTGIIGYHDDVPGVSASDTAPVVVFANHTCYQRIVHVPFSAIQNVLPFVPNPSRSRDIYWLHWATNGLVTLNDYKGHWPEFSAKKVAVPPALPCQQFGGFVRPLSLCVLKLERSSEILRLSRDLLLPRLISGELSVTEAERELDAVA